jgi:hypothetical protein
MLNSKLRGFVSWQALQGGMEGVNVVMDVRFA